MTWVSIVVVKVVPPFRRLVVETMPDCVTIRGAGREKYFPRGFVCPSTLSLRRGEYLGREESVPEEEASEEEASEEKASEEEASEEKASEERGEKARGA